MIRVDFYVLSDTRRDALARTACRLAEKAWHSGHDVFIHAGSLRQARQLDELLWTFRQESFVPHALYDEAGNAECPVRIGSGAEPPDAGDVLINFSETVPLFFTRFSRVAELVGSDPTAIEKGRARYLHYRSQGCSLQSHNV